MRRILDFWVRREACKMAARVMQNHTEEDPLTPRLWSITVFFETYMHEGAEGTRLDFGPHAPVELHDVSKTG